MQERRLGRIDAIDAIIEAMTGGGGTRVPQLIPRTRRTFTCTVRLLALMLTLSHVFCANSARASYVMGANSIDPETSAMGVAGLTPDHGLDAAQREAIKHVVRDSTGKIWFEKNVGQFPANARYGFRTPFGAMLVYDDHLRLISRQSDPTTKVQGQQVVDMSFTGSNAQWTILPGAASETIGSYQQPDGTALRPDIFKELTLRNVYDGVDLRLYSANKGIVELDWIVARAQNYEKIRIAATGQDGIVFHDDGSATLDLRYQDLALRMPETYQVIDGVKHQLDARMVAGDTPGEIRYALSGDIVNDQPLVIDPSILWSTYFDLNDAAFDSYLYAIATNSNGVYCFGWVRETITNALYGPSPGGSISHYMDVNAGFSQGTASNQAYIYRLNLAGTSITAWTGTGVTANTAIGATNQTLQEMAADLELFPNGRVLAGFASGLLQIYAADLSARYFNSERVTIDALDSVAIVDDTQFYASGRVLVAGGVGIPTTDIPLANIGPDTTFGANGTREGVIIRYTITTATLSPADSFVITPNWATYVGGSLDEYFTTVAVTPNGSKLVFATSTNVGTTGAPATYESLVNPVDNVSGAGGTATTELLVGVLPQQATKPGAFEVLSFLGGSGNEGVLGSNTTTAVVAATNTGFFVGGNTVSTNLPGTTTSNGTPTNGAASGFQTTNGGAAGTQDTFVSFIPLTGSAGAGFQSTYLGGAAADTMGGIAVDTVNGQLAVFGTTAAAGFPTLNSSPSGNYYDSTFTPGGNTGLDIFIAFVSTDLKTKNYVTLIGGNQDDYLGATGALIGQGHVYYSPSTGLFYLGTTSHSDLGVYKDVGAAIGQLTPTPPTPAPVGQPGKDLTKGNGNNDTHVLFAFSIPNTPATPTPTNTPTATWTATNTATATRTATNTATVTSTNTTTQTATVTPTATRTATNTATATQTATSTATATRTATNTATATQTATSTATATQTATNTATATQTATSTATATQTATNTATATRTATNTATATQTATSTATATRTATNTATATQTATNTATATQTATSTATATQTATNTATATRTATNTATATQTATNTATATQTATNTATATQTATNTATATQTATNTATATRTATNTATATQTATSTATATQTATSTATATQTATNTATATRTATNTATATQTATNTATATQTATNTATATRTVTSTATATRTVTSTATATQTATNTATATQTATNTVTATRTVTSTVTATQTATSTGTATPDDTDHDGIRDGEDPRPSKFDPSGFLYCEANGKIAPGGLVTVTGPGPIVLLNGLNGLNGEYSFKISVPGIYTLAVTPPPGDQLSQTCLQGPSPFDPPPPLPIVLSLGNPENGNTGFLTSPNCTTFYLSFNLVPVPGDPVIINNNIPLRCPSQPPTGIPLFPPWALLAGVIAVGSSVGLLALRRLHSPAWPRPVVAERR